MTSEPERSARKTLSNLPCYQHGTRGPKPPSGTAAPGWREAVSQRFATSQCEAHTQAAPVTARAMATARANQLVGPKQWQHQSDGHEPDTGIRHDTGEQLS